VPLPSVEGCGPCDHHNHNHDDDALGSTNDTPRAETTTIRSDTTKRGGNDNDQKVW
jgi:hypothetical protein